MLKLDHIAVVCADLGEGTSYVEAALGIEMLRGGKHARFGTHNTLLGLADGLYLEVIAPDPEAQIDGPRWFDLDNFEGPPRLGNWICRADDLDAALDNAPEDVGRPVALERGDLRWRMAVPEDGSLPMHGGYPTLIEWGKGVVLPGDTLPDSGCRLISFTVFHPDAALLSDRLSPQISDPRLRFVAGDAGFEARFEAPGGGAILK